MKQQQSADAMTQNKYTPKTVLMGAAKTRVTIQTRRCITTTTAKGCCLLTHWW
jgi:hypothetical protein